MSTERDHEAVLSSIRRLVAREVDEAEARDAGSFPARPPLRRFPGATAMDPEQSPQLAANGHEVPGGVAPGSADTASAARSRLTLGGASETPEPQTDPVIAETDVTAAGDYSDQALRELVRDVLREEVRTRMGPRINRIIRQVVREELDRILAASDQADQAATKSKFE
ncbi:MAG: hypothetical protein AAGF71_05410 [Pseudomonadota bacterium]